MILQKQTLFGTKLLCFITICIKQKGTFTTAQSFNEKGKSVFHQRKHIFLLDDFEIACNFSK